MKNYDIISAEHIVKPFTDDPADFVGKSQTTRCFVLRAVRPHSIKWRNAMYFKEWYE